MTLEDVSIAAQRHLHPLHLASSPSSRPLATEPTASEAATASSAPSQAVDRQAIGGALKHQWEWEWEREVAVVVGDGEAVRHSLESEGVCGSLPPGDDAIAGC